MSQIQRFIFNFRYYFIQLILWREVSEVFVTRLEDLFSDAMTGGADNCCSQGGRREWTGQDSPKATPESLVRHSYLNIKLQFLQTLNRFIIHYTFSYLVQCNKECTIYIYVVHQVQLKKTEWNLWISVLLQSYQTGLTRQCMKGLPLSTQSIV